MGNIFGQKWVDGDVATRSRMNWKDNVIDTGANIAALDYTTGLVSRYPFAGNSNDAQGSNNLTQNGSPTFGNGVYGQCITLNGSTQYDTAATNSVFDQTTTSFGFSIWVNVNTLPGSKGYIISKRNDAASSNVGYNVYVDNAGKINAELSDGTTLFTATGNIALTTSTWYLVEVHFLRGSTIDIYINGVFDNSHAQGTSTTITNSQTFTVGRNSNSGSFFDGSLDQLQVFSSSADLNAAQAHQINSDCHGGMTAFPTTSSGSLVSGQIARRNSENTAWVTIVDASSAATGDILHYNGTSFARLAMGSANQVLLVNSGGTDIAYGTVGVASLSSALTKMGTASFSSTTTSSTTPVDISGATVTITASGSRAGLVSISGAIGQTTTMGNIGVVELNDGSNNVKGTAAESEQSNVDASLIALSGLVVGESAPSSGSLTRKLRLRVITGTSATARVGDGHLVVMEVL